MNAATRMDQIRARLDATFSPLQCQLDDESALHAGHAGALTGKGHFRVMIVAPCFAGVAPLQRHRMIYTAVEALMNSDIHALSIDARAPAQS